MVSFSYKMKLLNAISPLVISKRFSRNSVIQYRRRRSLLKDYQIVKPSEENVYARLQAPLAEIVPVNEKKTSITIDILGEEGYNQLSEWRRNNLVRRARRVLPLPISLTTDDQVGQVWKQRFGRNSRRKEANLTEKLWNQIPNFVHYLMEKDAEMFRQQFPELYSQYQELMRYASDPNKKQIVDPKVYFPFLNALEKIDPKDFESLQEADESVESKVLDQEYENYLKHHNLLQYFASTLNTIHASEYEPEIEGWTSQFWLRNYGKPDASIPPSSVPCSGCGAHLHCTATNIPGFMPAAKFTLFNETELRTQLCQRCEFLKKYNVALNVTVSTEEYPALISKIQTNKCRVIVLVDLLDFPCSVWPGIVNLIGEKQSIYIVGNKVDLLPKDGDRYLERIRKSLKESLIATNISQRAKIRDVSLISAKTGYGVESLVTKLLRDIRPGEQIYLIGCTNSGKSTLFNVLMQTDLCAYREADLITRATTSLWPGTTLNLLKFPVNKLRGWEMEMRLRRLKMNEKNDIAERRLKWTMHRQAQPQYALLSERIGTTFRSNVPFKMDDDHPFQKSSAEAKPFNPDNPRFRNGNFLYDTPGVIYKDQLLNLLTTEELLRTIPREIITPRTYTIRPLQSLFIGGLARIDVAHARSNIWLTVFASHYLPVHIVYTEQARRFYEMYLGTDMLAVPIGNAERLERWPRLLPKEFEFECTGWERSAADIVLSTAGWVSVTGGDETKCILRAFTPEARGIYARQPAMLEHAIRLRGKRIPNTPCFENKCYTVDDLTQGAIPRRFFQNREQAHIEGKRLQDAVHFVKS